MKKRCFLGFLSILFSAFLSLNAFAADCAANHYTDTNGVCTPCPANSHSNGGDTPTCTCDDGFTASGLFNDSTEITLGYCREISEIGVVWAPVWPPQNSPAFKTCIIGETCTLPTEESISHWHDETVVLKYWQNADDPTKTYAPGQQIDENTIKTDSPDAWLRLAPVYGCAADYYGDGTTCTPCPANSHSDVGATVCTCDDGYSLNGYMINPNRETTTQDCEIMKYSVWYWMPPKENPPDIYVHENMPYTQPVNLLTSDQAKEMVPSLWPGEGYKIKKWVEYIWVENIGSVPTDIKFDPGQLVTVDNLREGRSSMELAAEFECAAGYYGDGATCTVCPEHSTSVDGATVCTCDDGYRMADNVCKPCPNGVCVDPAPIRPTCNAGYHVEESTNTCVGNTLNIVFQNGGSYNYEVSDLPAGLRVTHGEPVPVLSGLETIGPDMRYQEVVAAGTAKMGVKNWAFDGVPAWLADGSVDTYSMGTNPIVSTALFPESGDLTVSPEWKTIALRCNAGYYNKGVSNIGKGNCTPCLTTGNQICPGMTEFKPTSERSGIETCGANSSPNDARTECVCNPGYAQDTITRICTEKTYTITYDDNTDYSFNHFGSYTIKAPDARDGYVFEYWVDNNGTQYTAGQTISGSDLTYTDITLTGVWHCAANYYGDGATCTACPANSHSDKGATVCTCDEGYSLNGYVTDPSDQETTTTDCKIRRYGVEYWIGQLNQSRPPDREILIPHNETCFLLTAEEGKTISENIGTWPGEGYIIEKWQDRNSEALFLPGEQVDKNDVPTGRDWLDLVAVFGCVAGYYDDGNTCTICPAGSYCPGDGKSYACTTGYTSAAGATQKSECYLITEPGKAVITANSDQETCPQNNYCVGNQKIIYGGTGGARQCPNTHPNSGDGSDEEEDCYKNCETAKVENGTADPDEDIAQYPNECAYSTWTSDAGNPCNIIMKDGDRFCYEPNCPFDQEMLTPGVCEPCNVAHADKYDEDAHGNCIVKTCDDVRYTPYLNECLEKEKQCTAEHATKAYRSWDEKYLAYGPCLVKACDENYHIDANACESDISPCDIKNGVGERKWEGSNWSACYVKRCERGFMESDDQTQCVRCDNYYDEKGNVAVSSYIKECDIATCMYQGEKYILKDNECSLICTDKEDETGSRHWNEETQKCEHTCNDGYLQW